MPALVRLGGGDGREVFCRSTRQVGSLREVLPEQAVGGFVRAALPGTVWSAKNTGIPVSILNWACADSSLLRSQVRDLRITSDRPLMVAARAFFIVIAP